MSNTVGIAELRQNLSKHLERVKAGERLIVTDRNRPVATLGPPPENDSWLERMIAEGKVRPRTRDTLPDPIQDPGWSTDDFLAMRDEDRHR